MKAAILKRIGEPLEMVDIDIQDTSPAIIYPGQVFVRMLSTGICGAQLQEIDGFKGDPNNCPHTLGHEGCGIVEDFGAGVTRVKKGDKVVVHWRKSAGCDPSPIVYEGGIKSGPCTTFSEYTFVSENRVTPIPKDVPDELAALFGCCLSTALAVAENEIRWGQSVLVSGCGGVGLAMILAARLAHANVTATDTVKSKAPSSVSIGAEWQSDFCAADIGRFDVILDTTGSEEAMLVAMDMLAPSGKYIMIGQPRYPIALVNPQKMFEGEGKTIKATQAGGFTPHRDIPRYVELWRSGALDGWKNIITHRISLDQVNDGIAMMRAGKTGRVMIRL